MRHVTWPRPFQGQFVVCRLGLAMINLHTKVEASTLTQPIPKTTQNVEILGALEVRVTQDHQQPNHLM